MAKIVEMKILYEFVCSVVDPMFVYSVCSSIVGMMVAGFLILICVRYNYIHILLSKTDLI